MAVLMKRFQLFVLCAVVLFFGSMASVVNADTFNSDGVEIFYTVRGQGESVVLVHGFTASGASNFVQPGVADGLASKYQVITIDNRGHGASGKPHDPAQYGEQMVEDVINLMDHLNIEKARIVGYSMGGLITQKLITLYPERVVQAVSGGFGWGSDQEGGALDNISTLADSLESGNGIGPLIVALTPPGQPQPTPEMLAQVNMMLMATNDPLALAAAVRSFGALADVSRETLGANKIPLMYIVGENDPLKADVDRSRGVAGNAQYVVVPGSDHMTTFAQPLFLESIQKFFAMP